MTNFPPAVERSKLPITINNTDQLTRDLDVDGERALSSFFLNRPHCAVGSSCESDWAEPLGDVGTLGDPCIERLHETSTVLR